MLHGTASPAEVFHRNLVDAVSNVEGNRKELQLHIAFSFIFTYGFFFYQKIRFRRK